LANSKSLKWTDDFPFSVSLTSLRLFVLSLLLSLFSSWLFCLPMARYSRCYPVLWCFAMLTSLFCSGSIKRVKHSCSFFLFSWLVSVVPRLIAYPFIFLTRSLIFCSFFPSEPHHVVGRSARVSLECRNKRGQHQQQHSLRCKLRIIKAAWRGLNTRDATSLKSIVVAVAVSPCCFIRCTSGVNNQRRHHGVVLVVAAPPWYV
jgi:hypothetical protein